MKKIFILFTFLISRIFSFAQTDACHLRVSLLTCTPGAELYSIFGHSALRVVDSINHSDVIFNYGTFDFDDPSFYKKFIQGKLLYFVSVENIDDFLQEYKEQQRGITEQVLALSCTEEKNLLEALIENAREENKYYKYDFVYDNCTTRLRDIVTKFSSDSVVYKNILPAKNTTFRKLIHEYLDKGGLSWSKFGIDILLGSPIDKRITNTEAMFLPDYLLKGFDSGAFNQKKMVLEKTIIMRSPVHAERKNFFTPLTVFSILFVFIATLSLLQSKKAKTFLRFFDFIFFFLCGMLGVLLVYMWLGTDHQSCRNNFNLLWAVPVNLPMAFFLHKKSAPVKNYFSFIFWLTVAFILLWFLLPQQMNIALLPVAGIIALRSFYHSKKAK